jgi:hypothetical protein
MSRTRLNATAANTIRLMVLERVSQLESVTENLNVISKQRELLAVADEIILRANNAPKGLVEVVFTDKKPKKEWPIERILLNSTVRVTAMNVDDPEEFHSLYRTIIVVDPQWSDNFDVYQSQYGLPVSHLKRIKNEHV